MQKMAIVYEGQSNSNFDVNVVVVSLFDSGEKCKNILLEEKLCICAFTNNLK